MVLLYALRLRLQLGAELLLVVAALVCLPSGGQHARAQEGARSYRVVYVAPDDVLNIRSGPSVGYPVVGMIPPRGRGVRIVGECDEWCPVRYNGASGWVNGRYLAAEPSMAAYSRDDEDDDEPPLPRTSRKRAQLPAYWRVTGIAEGESLKVHDGPSSHASVVHAFEPQSGCIRLAGTCQKPWCQVAFPGLSGDRLGWVDSKHLSPSQEACRR
jgi:SH3-like domain-containing protein